MDFRRDPKEDYFKFPLGKSKQKQKTENGYAEAALKQEILREASGRPRAGLPRWCEESRPELSLILKRRIMWTANHREDTFEENMEKEFHKMQTPPRRTANELFLQLGR